MDAGWLAALEGSAPAAFLRNSSWMYPLVNAGHILGVALLVGGSVPLSLRLLGAWSSIPIAGLRRVLTRTADTGLALAVGFGFLLFMTRASGYAGSGIFISKMLLLAAGIAVTLMLRLSTAEKPVDRNGAPGGLRIPVHLTAGLSLVIWPTVLVLGRLIGYF